MKFQTSIATACLGLCATAIICTASVAQAADRKVYSGLSCVEIGDTTPELEYQSSGAVRNVDTTWTWVQCSVVRDNELSTMDVLDWDIVVNRNGNMDNWWVELWSVSADGTSGNLSSITVPNVTGYQSLDGGTITWAATNGIMWLRTEIPAGADLINYSVQEST
jgi:hypothetical protein